MDKMPKPINVVQGHYFLGTEPLPDDPVEREKAVHWYQLGYIDGTVAERDSAVKPGSSWAAHVRGLN